MDDLCPWAAHDYVYGKSEIVCVTVGCGCKYDPKEIRKVKDNSDH
jgi:hypothetical protein